MRRPRIRIGTLMLLVAIVGLAVALIVVRGREATQAAKLRAEEQESRARAMLAQARSAAVGSPAAVLQARPSPGDGRPTREEAEAIEDLHRRDVAATLSGDPAALAELWDEDAVRLEPGGPAEVGQAVIRSHDRRDAAKRPPGRVVAYAPEIRDLRVSGGWAFEWGEFRWSSRDAPSAPAQKFRGHLLRVLRRQSDGSWRFARVAWTPADEGGDPPPPK